MYGYIHPREDELDYYSKNTLKRYYCSLCISLKKSYGNFSRFLINYDILLPLIIIDSLNVYNETIKTTKCILHPQKNIQTINNKNIKYITDTTILLAYYKTLDNKYDENKNKIKNNLFFYSIKTYKNKISYNFLDEIFYKNLSRLSIYEKDSIYHSLDTICDPFSNLVGKLLSNAPCTIKDNSLKTRIMLYNLGYNLGKWIYIIDAFDDLDNDYTSNNFNPLLNSTFSRNLNKKKNHFYKDKNFYHRILTILLSLLDNCIDITSKINFTSNQSLIKNYLNNSLKNTTMNIFISK